MQTVKCSSVGFVGAIRWVGGKLYTGGKDGLVKIWACNGGNLTEEASIDFGGVLIRAIDVLGGSMLVGLRDGTIYQVDVAS
jgi:WD40 repeat protein